MGFKNGRQARTLITPHRILSAPSSSLGCKNRRSLRSFESPVSRGSAERPTPRTMAMLVPVCSALTMSSESDQRDAWTGGDSWRDLGCRGARKVLGLPVGIIYRHPSMGLMPRAGVASDLIILKEL
jgi:hypothetical protein